MNTTTTNTKLIQKNKEQKSVGKKTQVMRLETKTFQTYC